MANQDDTIGSTGDYATTQLWLDGVRVETGDHIGRVQNEVVSGGMVINHAAGSVSASSFTLQPATGAEHDGRARDVSSTGAQLAHSDRVIYCFNTNGATLTVQDLDIKGTGTNPTTHFQDASGHTIQRCVLQNTSSGACLTNVGATSLLNTYDNIIYGGTGWGIDYRSSGNSVGNIVGNTVCKISTTAGYGILPGTGVTRVANNIVLNFTTECYFGDDNTDGNHGSNFASDASADTEYGGGGGSVNSVEVLETGDTPTGSYIAFVNLTSGSEDFHLVDLEDGTYSNVALAGGIASIGSGFDIDNTARDGTTPDAGADEYVAPGGGGTIIPKIQHHRRQMVA